MQFGEKVDHVHKNEIKKGNVTAQQQHGNNDNQGRVPQLLIAAEPFFFGVPRPLSFLELDLYFVEELSCLRDHLIFQETSNIQRRTSNAQLLLPNSKFSVRRWAFGVCGLSTRQEGLEPPTDGFGDRYSTN